MYLCMLFWYSLLPTVIDSSNSWECSLVCDWLPGNQNVGMATKMNLEASFSFVSVDSWSEHGRRWVHSLLFTDEWNEWLRISVFFNLFFEVEHFAAILIAHGTHGIARNLFWGYISGSSGRNLRPKAKSGEGFIGKGGSEPLCEGCNCKLPQWGSGGAPTTKAFWTH